MAAEQALPLLLPDAGPLITLAYAGRLDLLLRPGWPLRLVDMVLDEVTRNATPSRDAITAFVAEHRPPIVETGTFRSYQARLARTTSGAEPPPRKAGLGELAMQEAINQLALLEPPQSAVLLFEDHKIARTTFFLPEGTLRVSTRAFLIFLEEKGWLASAAEVEQDAIRAGRAFSRLRFPSRQSRADVPAGTPRAAREPVINEGSPAGRRVRYNRPPSGRSSAW